MCNEQQSLRVVKCNVDNAKIGWRDICMNVEKKPVFSIRNAFLFVLQFGILVGTISIIILYDKLPIGNLDGFSIINITSVQVSISLISITILQLILPDSKERIFGITYQNILFKWKVLKYFNALDCMMYMLFLMIISILLAVASEIIANINIQRICKLSFLCTMVESFLLAVYMIYLGLITKFKKSRIYYLLYKRLGKKDKPNRTFKPNTRNYEVYNLLVKGMLNPSFKADDEYLKDELAILEYMYQHEEFLWYKGDKKRIMNKIEEEKKNREKLISNFQ